MKKMRKILGMLLVCFVVLSSGVFSGKVWAVGVGEQLTQPEAGWSRFDDVDSRIIHNGSSWESHSGDSNAYGSDYIWCRNGLGLSMQFKFYGTQLRLIDYTYSDFSTKIKITIDDKVTNYSVNKGPMFMRLVFESDVLSNGVHTVTLYKEDNQGWNPDAIDIKDGYLVPQNYIGLESMVLDKTSTNILTGGTDTVAATVYPSNATNQNITWSISDSTIASITPNGLNCSIAGLKVGTTTLTATTQEGNIVKTCTITVTEPNHPVTGITLDKTSICLNRDQAEQVTATITPENATNKNILWSIDDSSIAKITSNGLTCSVTGSNYGTTILRAKTEDGNIIATCTITVVPKVIGRSLLTIYLSNQTSRQYDVTTEELNAFLTWYDNRASGSGSVRYGFSKPVSSPAFSKRTEYVIFDKIVAFDVDDYSITEK